MDISFNVTGQIITRTEENVIVGDSKNYHRATFTFSSEWMNINKVAQFSKKIANFKNGPVFDCLIEDNSCLIPWEVLTDSGTVELSIFGGDLITTRPVVFNVAPSGLKTGQLPAEPSPGYFDQLVDFLKYKFIGPKGDKGDKGDKGEQGIQGIPGEVQLSDLASTIIAYTDTNSNLGDATDVQMALDSAGAQVSNIGSRTYTEQNYVTDAESLTESIDALDTNLKSMLPVIYRATWKTGSVSTNFAYTNDLVVPAGTYLVTIDAANEDDLVGWFGEAGAAVLSGNHYLKVNPQQNVSRVMTFVAQATVNVFNQRGLSTVTLSGSTKFFELTKL